MKLFYSFAVSLVSLVALVELMPMSALAEEDAARTIQVTGEGEASAPPDKATVSTGVVTQASTASKALAANSKAMDKVMSAIKDHDIDAKDIQTSSFNVSPIHKTDEQGRTQPEVVAYRVSNQLQVEVRDLSRLGEVLDALVAAGSNQISGIGFEIEDASAVLKQARERAVADAKGRAQTYAVSAGVKLGKVRTISEQSSYTPQPRLSRQVFAADAAKSYVPVATGTQNVKVKVNMVFGLEDAR